MYYYVNDGESLDNNMYICTLRMEKRKNSRFPDSIIQLFIIVIGSKSHFVFVSFNDGNDDEMM